MMRYLLIAVLSLTSIPPTTSIIFADTATPSVKAEKRASGDRKCCSKKDACKDKEKCKDRKTAGAEKKACCSAKKEKKA